ncbi:DUF350 domain-containing protein [Rhodococcus sp. NPDC060086]|uniref:DUF350 domain-containing protein n=1 Tax=unclassified Rhodococcus (in: high G+C Gram-positive bacteria) TaxID=192944 RepID=UPI003649E6BF
MTVTLLAADLEIGTVDPSLLLQGVVATLIYFVIGVGVLALGFTVLDGLTPGNLRHQVYVDHNPNAALLLGANHLALAIIVVTAIATSADGFAQGITDSLVYGLIGVLLQAAALLIMNRVLPGQITELVSEPRMNGAAWAVAVTLLSVGLVNAVALS